jgi:hypothetical protein
VVKVRKGGSGIGSASLILIFAVLCLTVFSLITFAVAENERVIVEKEARLVVGFYEADALAERVLASLLGAESTADYVRNVTVGTLWDYELNAELSYFSIPITEHIELYVMVAIYEESFDILRWRMRNRADWVADDGLNVWTDTE